MTSCLAILSLRCISWDSRLAMGTCKQRKVPSYEPTQSSNTGFSTRAASRIEFSRGLLDPIGSSGGSLCVVRFEQHATMCSNFLLQGIGCTGPSPRPTMTMHRGESLGDQDHACPPHAWAQAPKAFPRRMLNRLHKRRAHVGLVVFRMHANMNPFGKLDAHLAGTIRALIVTGGDRRCCPGFAS